MFSVFCMMINMLVAAAAGTWLGFLARGERRLFVVALLATSSACASTSAPLTGGTPASVEVRALNAPLHSQEMSPATHVVTARTTAAKAAVLSNDLIDALLEQSYVTAFGGIAGNRDKLVFEGNIAPHFYVTPFDRFAFVFTPKVVVRMFRVDSKPVRTPSYMPRASLFAPVGARGFMQHFAFLTLSHHSNGQEGEFLNPDGSVNFVDGNFSTNFVELGAQAVWSRSETRTLNGYSLSVEYHPTSWMEEAMRETYSQARVKGSFRGVLFNDWGIPASIVGERISFIVAPTVLLDGTPPPATAGFDRVNLWTAVSVRPSWMDQLSVFVNYYWGQDYYNLYFNRRLSVVRIGFGTQGPTTIDGPAATPRTPE